jgi:hypothetical protein
MKVMMVATLRANSPHDIAIALVLQDAILGCPIAQSGFDHRVNEDSIENRGLVSVFDDALTVNGAEKLPVRFIVKVTSHAALAIEHVLKALVVCIEVGNVRIQAALVRGM